MEVGQIVRAFYKTGTYVGEITAVRPDGWTVRILAVLKHPMQGNLHHPREIDVPYFHERKALSYREQANIPKKMVKPYEEEVPNYEASLQLATQALYDDLKAKPDDPYSVRSLETLKEAMRDYELRYDVKWDVLHES